MKKNLSKTSEKALEDFDIAAQVWGVGRDSFSGAQYDDTEVSWQRTRVRLYKRLLHLARARKRQAASREEKLLPLNHDPRSHRSAGRPADLRPIRAARLGGGPTQTGLTVTQSPSNRLSLRKGPRAFGCQPVTPANRFGHRPPWNQPQQIDSNEVTNKPPER